jgi:hypothetical protein
MPDSVHALYRCNAKSIDEEQMCVDVSLWCTLCPVPFRPLLPVKR